MGISKPQSIHKVSFSFSLKIAWIVSTYFVTLAWLVYFSKTWLQQCLKMFYNSARKMFCKVQCQVLFVLLCLSPCLAKSPREMGLLVAHPWPDTHLYGHIIRLLQSVWVWDQYPDSRSKMPPSPLTAFPQKSQSKDNGNAHWKKKICPPNHFLFCFPPLI